MLDFTNMPRPWKLYDASLSETPLPSELTRTGVSVGDSLQGAESPSVGEAGLSLSNLASVLQLSAGITKRLRTGNGYMYFRAAACTGALYHIEVYVVSGPLSDLPAGVYQYGAHDNTLRMLRNGDFREVAVQAAGLAHTPAAIVVYTSTFWRNSWKYGSRTYRHAFWDCGTVLAHSLAAARANGAKADLVTRYADTPVNDLIDVDEETEVSVALLPLGTGPETSPVDVPTRLDIPVVPLSPQPHRLPLDPRGACGNCARRACSSSSGNDTRDSACCTRRWPHPARRRRAAHKNAGRRHPAARFVAPVRPGTHQPSGAGCDARCRRASHRTGRR